MSLTYRELRDTLNRMHEDDLDSNVSVYLEQNDEFYPVDFIGNELITDVLDDGHYVLVINNVTGGEK